MAREAPGVAGGGGLKFRFSQDVKDLAEFMHYNYLEIAEAKGWKVQENTNVSFEDLPQENRDIMLVLASKIMGWFLLDVFEVAT